MATYYVRKTGVDTNGGTSAGAAWLTIGKALTVITAADIVYIGAGVYRESGLSLSNSGSAGNIITIQGDLDGSKTGDGGIVRITASADDNAYTNSHVFALSATASYVTFDSLWMDMASSELFVASNGNTNNTNLTIQNSWFTNGKDNSINIGGHDALVKNCFVWNFSPGGWRNIKLDGGNGTVDSVIVRSIRAGGAETGIYLQAQTTYTTITVKNCYVEDVKPDGGAPDNGIHFDMNSVASAVANCYNNHVQRIKSGGANAAEGIRFGSTVATNTLNIYNNSIQNVLADAGTTNSYAIVVQGTAPTINGDYNMWSDCRDGVSGYTANTHDKANSAINIHVPMLPQSGQFGMYHDASSGGYDAGTTNSGAAPTVDMMGNPRAGAFGMDIGPIEKQGSIVVDTTTYNTAAPATRLDGCGYIDFKFAINNTKTATIKAYIKTNASYSGTQPSFGTVAGASNTGQSGTVTYSGASNAWQQVTIPTTSMLATADGVLTVRFQTYSTAASSSAWIDDITITEA